MTLAREALHGSQENAGCSFNRAFQFAPYSRLT